MTNPPPPKTPPPLVSTITGASTTSGSQHTVSPTTLRSNNPFTPDRLSMPINLDSGANRDSQAAAIFAADLTRPSVTTRTVCGTGWTTGLELKFTEHNWGKWIEQLDIALGISAMTGYTDGRKPVPDAALEPRAMNAYRDNDGGIIAFIRQKIDATERAIIKDCFTSREAITLLRNRHLNRGPQAQVLLLTELLGVNFSRSTPLADTVTAMTDLNDRIWDGGAPTKESILLIASINALRAEFPDLTSQFMTLLTKGSLTLEYISDRLAAEQMNITSSLSTPTVLTATKNSTNPFQKNARSVEVCANRDCGETGHSIETCIKVGGGMAGCSLDEARSAKKAIRDGKAGRGRNSNTPNAPSLKKLAFQALKDGNGNACFAIEGQLFYPSAPANRQTQPPAPSLVPMLPTNPFTGHIAASPTTLTPSGSGLTSDSLSSLITPGDEWELFGGVAIADDPRTSVDWSLYHQNVEVANVAVRTDIKDGRAPLSHAEYPFLLDSGANVSISGERMDFATLTPISPRPIRGVGGTTVNAIGVGTVRLVLGKGRHLDINDVLYVPSAPLRLLSVLLINRNGSNASHFDSSCCWITNASGATVAAGYVTSRDLYALSTTDISTSHNYAAYLSSAACDIDTWHQRFGHANYKTVVDMSRSGAVQG